MKKRIRILSSFIVGLSFSLAVTVALALAFAFDGRGKADELESGYERSFYTLCDSVNNLETDLSKLTVARGNAESVELIQSAHANAQTAIVGYSGLPIDFNNEYRCLKFFNQVADWASCYVRSAARGEGEAYKQNAQDLYETARVINQNLKEIARKTEGKKLYTAVGDNLLPSGLENIDFSLSSPTIEYPTLIYDGPFSDDTTVKAKAIENKKEISEQKAVEIARSAFGMSEVKLVGNSGSSVAAYELEGKVDGEYAYCSITKKGGYVLNFTSNDGVDYENSVSEKQAESIGKSLLARLGFTNMQAVWFNSINGDVYVNFAPVIGDVTYYTDLVKIRVSGGGKVEGMDASGYLSSFSSRKLSPTISKEQAMQGATDINVKSVTLALIPKNGGERFCYEIYGERKGLDYYIYVDATTGEQVDIMRVVDSAQGRKAV